MGFKGLGSKLSEKFLEKPPAAAAASAAAVDPWKKPYDEYVRRIPTSGPGAGQAMPLDQYKKLAMGKGLDPAGAMAAQAQRTSGGGSLTPSASSSSVSSTGRSSTPTPGSWAPSLDGKKKQPAVVPAPTPPPAAPAQAPMPGGDSSPQSRPGAMPPPPRSSGAAMPAPTPPPMAPAIAEQYEDSPQSSHSPSPPAAFPPPPADRGMQQPGAFRPHPGPPGSHGGAHGALPQIPYGEDQYDDYDEDDSSESSESSDSSEDEYAEEYYEQQPRGGYRGGRAGYGTPYGNGSMGARTPVYGGGVSTPNRAMGARSTKHAPYSSRSIPRHQEYDDAYSHHGGFYDDHRPTTPAARPRPPPPGYYYADEAQNHYDDDWYVEYEPYRHPNPIDGGYSSSGSVSRSGYGGGNGGLHRSHTTSSSHGGFQSRMAPSLSRSPSYSGYSGTVTGTITNTQYQDEVVTAPYADRPATLGLEGKKASKRPRNQAAHAALQAPPPVLGHDPNQGQLVSYDDGSIYEEVYEQPHYSGAQAYTGYPGY